MLQKENLDNYNFQLNLQLLNDLKYKGQGNKINSL